MRVRPGKRAGKRAGGLSERGLLRGPGANQAAWGGLIRVGLAAEAAPVRQSTCIKRAGRPKKHPQKNPKQTQKKRKRLAERTGNQGAT